MSDAQFRKAVEDEQVFMPDVCPTSALMEQIEVIV